MTLIITFLFVLGAALVVANAVMWLLTGSIFSAIAVVVGVGVLFAVGAYHDH
jgi:hypothetical protein